MRIVKQTTGLITITDPSGTYASISFSNATVRLKADNTTFEVWEFGRLAYSFQFADVQSTQILPAAAVVPTSVSGLLSTLQTSFFFELASSGGSGGSGVGDKLFLYQNFN